MKAEQLTAVVAEHGEGPVYSRRWSGPRFVDMLAGDICELNNDLTIKRHHVGPVAAMIRPRRHRGTVVAGEHSILVSDSDAQDAPLTEIVTILRDSDLRLNEGACDPCGNLLIGSMAYDERPGVGVLYCVRASEADTSVPIPVLNGVTISNGLDWSPDGHFAYYVDTPTHTVDVFDWSGDQGLTNRRPFARPPGPGAPDGLTVDEQGGVWVASFGGSCVHRFDADGTLDCTIEIPARQVTAVAFAGPSLDRLIITTSRYGLGADAEPAAGALFIAHPGVRGVQVREFAA